MTSPTRRRARAAPGSPRAGPACRRTRPGRPPARSGPGSARWRGGPPRGRRRIRPTWSSWYAVGAVVGRTWATQRNPCCRRARPPTAVDRHPEQQVGEGQVGEQLPVAGEPVQVVDVGWTEGRCAPRPGRAAWTRGQRVTRRWRYSVAVTFFRPRGASGSSPRASARASASCCSGRMSSSGA